MAKFFCELCETAQPVIIEPCKKDSLNGEKIWGDIVCKECHLVIATIECDEAGEYEFVRKEKTPPGDPMNKTERLKYCIGCRNNFYNDNNSLDIKECWSLKDAKMVSKKEVHIDQVPPWTQKPIRLLSCFHKDGFWYVEPDRIN